MWDAICARTHWLPHSALVTREAGTVAERAEWKKRGKYAHLDKSHHFVSVAVETLQVFSPEVRSCLF